MVSDNGATVFQIINVVTYTLNVCFSIFFFFFKEYTEYYLSMTMYFSRYTILNWINKIRCLCSENCGFHDIYIDKYFYMHSFVYEFFQIIVSIKNIESEKITRNI